MTDIFISYRRTDSAGYAGRLFDWISNRVGRQRVFFDVSSLKGGDVWREDLRDHLAGCRVMLVVMAPDWFTARDEHGRDRLSDPTDIVRTELLAAASAGKRLIPVLVGGAVFPPAETLPEAWPAPLRDIGSGGRQMIRIGHETFDADVLQLEAALKSALPDVEFRSADPVSSIRQAQLGARAIAGPLLAAVFLTWATNTALVWGNTGLTADELAPLFVVWCVITIGASRFRRHQRSVAL